MLDCLLTVTVAVWRKVSWSSLDFLYYGVASTPSPLTQIHVTHLLTEVAIRTRTPCTTLHAASTLHRYCWRQCRFWRSRCHARWWSRRITCWSPRCCLRSSTWLGIPLAARALWLLRVALSPCALWSCWSPGGGRCSSCSWPCGRASLQAVYLDNTRKL